MLGLPRNMDGSEGPRAQATRAFARNLAGLTELPITFWDERLSTVAAERALLEADASRRGGPRSSTTWRRATSCRGCSTGSAHLERAAMSDEVWRREEVESPCVKLCVVHPAARLCLGCYRTVDEIAAWRVDDPEARRAVMAELRAGRAHRPRAGARRRRGGRRRRARA